MRKTVKKIGAAVLAAGIAGAGMGAWSGSDFIKFAETDQPRTYEQNPEVLPELSGVSYYEYQWGLKNKGNLRRVSYSDSNSGRTQRRGPGEYPTADHVGMGEVREGTAGIDIGIEQAWEIYGNLADRREVTVALVDTGADISHPELQDAVWVNGDEIPGNGIDDDNNGYVDDVHGWNFYHGSSQVFTGDEDTHGTHGAGTIAGAWNGQGISGIADSSYVKIMVLKVLGSEEGSGRSEHVKQAIRYAEANGADICSLSLGSGQYDAELDEMIRNSSMLFVVSAGNGDGHGHGYDIDTWPVYPASYSGENVITVGNLMFDGTLSESSNYGAQSVDIAAPGTYILSSVPGGYGFMSGTSMAAPMVTGVAALVYSSRLDLNLPGVKRAVIDSARRLDTMEGKTVSGGILDAYGAITYENR